MALLRHLTCAASWYRIPAAFLRIAGHNCAAALFRNTGESFSRVNPRGEMFLLVWGFDEIFGAMPERPEDRPNTAASESHLLQISPPGLRPVPCLSWVGGFCPLRNLCTGIPLCSAAGDKYPLPSFAVYKYVGTWNSPPFPRRGTFLR